MANNADRSVFQDIARGFRGPQAWMMGLVWVMTLVFFVVAVLSAIRFFEVETTKLQIMYAALFLFSMQTVGLLKMWVWNQINRHAILDALR